MSNGEGTCEATSEVASPDPFDSFNSLRLRQSDGADASLPSSRYSSCGESEFERYCSANSVMGTPSMCSTITVYNDFGFADDIGLENFSLGERALVSPQDQKLSTSGVSDDSERVFSSGFRRENNRNQQNLKYGSSGLELYGDDNDELTMTMLDTSSLMGVNQMHEHLRQDFVQKDHLEEHNELGGPRDDVENQSSDGSDDAGTTERYLLGDVDGKCPQSVQALGEGGLSCAVGGEDELYGFDSQSSLQNVVREIEREEDGNSLNFEHSEGEDSMYNYGSDNDIKTEFHLARNIRCHQESKVRNENPLQMNSSIAFGSEDLDDLLLENEQNAQASPMFNAFRNQTGRNPEVEDNGTKLSNVNSMKFSSPGQKEGGKDTKETVIVSQKVEKIKDLGEPEEINVVRDTPASQAADKLANIKENSSDASTYFPKIVKPQHDDVRDIYVAKSIVQGADKLVTCPKSFSISKPYEVDQDPLAEEAPLVMGLNVNDDRTIEEGHLQTNTEKAIGASDAQLVDNLVLNNSKLNLDLLSDDAANQHLGKINTEPSENLEQDEPSATFERRKTFESSSTSENLFEKAPVTTEMENFEMNEFYDEMVHEMEEILLDSISSPGSRLAQINRLIEPHLSLPLRDGGSTASTSGTDDVYPLFQRPVRIDRIEVVGAKQKKGDVSFSERLVGVKEYTVYKIRVWSGKDQWEVERRYRDFLSLHRRMKNLFAEQGWVLPLPWSSVEKESKTIFGSASPDVVAHRSILIQECLQSLLHTRFFSSPPGALIWFLTPQYSYPSSPASNASETQSYIVTRGSESLNSRNFSTWGKTISLIVEIQPPKSIKELLEAQHYTCAGCHKHFDDGKTLIWDFIQAFGWGKPRLCEYTGQLCCSACHTNETAVLPARVLHHWDFTKYPVSQLAKSYLDSIHDQPMLCVTAVNPFLLSKVPALLHVMSIRKKIGTMLTYVCCPFRSSINRGLGSRRYLLESNDFFALRDLIDLSKGAFAALPVMVETVSRKILEHITEQCLICCDVGLPCSARQDCSDPSSLIFPFQEDEIKRCKNCQSVFHKRCFRKLGSCLCEAQDEPMGLTNRLASQRGRGATRGTLDKLGRGLSSGLSTRLFSGLFSKEKPEKNREPKDENIILMGSLPNTTL